MQLAPFGEERDDYRAALIALSVWNVQIAKNTKKGSTPKFRDLREFILCFGDTPDPMTPTKKQTPKEQWQTLVGIFKATARRKG